MHVHNFRLRHSFLVSCRDSHIKLIRYLSNYFRKWLLPEPSGEMIIQTLEGHRFYINPALDKGVEQDLYYYGTYERGILDFMSGFLREGDVFVDAGANIGLMSVHASRRVGKTGRVFSFEANPDTVKILRKNLDLNNCTNDEIIPHALGAAAGTGKIYSNWHVNRGGASLIRPEVDSVSHDIEIKRFDDFYHERKLNGIRLVKADVEGFELEVLKGFGPVLTEKNAPALILECSDQRGNFKSTKEDMYRHIREVNSYRIYVLSKGKEVISPLREVKNEQELPSHDNIICLLEPHIRSLRPGTIEPS